MFLALSLLLALACMAPAAAKLAGAPAVRESAAHFGIPWNRYRLISVPELAAAIGVLAGLQAHALGVAAACGMAILLTGALIAHEGPGTASRRWHRRWPPAASRLATWPWP